MIINITGKQASHGYLSNEGEAIFYGFFPTANLAIKRELIHKLGKFDENCTTGEDLDLNVRAAKNNITRWFDNRATVYHYHRTTMKSLLKQWLGYGLGHPYLYRKHRPAKTIDLYITKNIPPNALEIYKKCSIPFFFPIVIFPSKLLLIHLLALLLLLTIITSASIWYIYSLCGLIALLFFSTNKTFFSLQYFNYSVKFIFVRTICDYVYYWARIWGGIKQRMIYLGPSMVTSQNIDYTKIKSE